jgi:Tetratricopeptide repeat
MRLPARGCLAVLGCLMLAAAPASAAAKVAMTPMQADSVYQHHDWPAAIRAYDALTRSEPTNGRYWYRLGNSHSQLKQYREAVEALTHSEAIGHQAIVMIKLGSTYALAGDKDHAFEWLDRAAAAGFGDESQLDGDADLASLRDDPRYKATLAKVHAIGAPCETRPEFHQFDFWIGEWNVKSQQGPLVGHSSIQQILGQCVIFENWTGVQGGSGKSFNSYDTASNAWRQFWVDDRGTVTEFTDGQYRDGAMRFATHGKAPDGKDVLGRLSFYNLTPDRVRQWKERSVDGGTTWTTDYDFVYERVK